MTARLATALFVFYAAVLGAACWGVANVCVDALYRADEEALLMGTWRQSCTQLLTQHGRWSYAASHACGNAYPTLENALAVLND